MTTAAPARFRAGLSVSQAGEGLIVLPTVDQQQTSDFLTSLILHEQTRPMIQRLDGRQPQVVVQLRPGADHNLFKEVVCDLISDRFDEVEFYQP